MKILIIDDEDDIRAISRLALGRVGGMDVVEQDGPETLGLLKADPRTAHIPVVFLTAKAMASELERLRALGAKGVLTKPFDPMSLAANVRAILEAG